MLLRVIRFVLILFILCAVGSWAALSRRWTAIAVMAAQAPVTDVAAPLTETERKAIEVVTLKARLASAYKQIADLQAAVGTCQGQLGPAQFEQNKQALDSERAAVKDAIEKARPGYTWDPDSGQFARRLSLPPAPKKDGGS